MLLMLFFTIQSICFVPKTKYFCFQVHLISSKFKGNNSVIRWAVFPADSGDYFSNITAMVMSLSESNILNLKIEPFPSLKFC